MNLSWITACPVIGCLPLLIIIYCVLACCCRLFFSCGDCDSSREDGRNVRIHTGPRSPVVPQVEVIAQPRAPISAYRDAAAIPYRSSGLGRTGVTVVAPRTAPRYDLSSAAIHRSESGINSVVKPPPVVPRQCAEREHDPYLEAVLRGLLQIPACRAPEADIDHFQLVLQYGPGWCTDKQCNGSQTMSRFILHGLWPCLKTGDSDALQEIDIPYDEAVNDKLSKELTRDFTPLLGDSPHSHWKHQWNKHGKKAAMMPSLGTQKKYFKKALDLHRQFPILEYLREAGISPSNTRFYTLRQVRQVIQTKLRKRIRMTTKKSQAFKQPVLSEVAIYLDTNFEAINCPENGAWAGELLIPRAEL